MRIGRWSWVPVAISLPLWRAQADEAFSCGPGSKMRRQDRCVIW